MREPYLCVHGHFYQPPRENPWTDEVEPEATARPYHDWNERITAECYAPNAAAKILDSGRVVNNYAQVSFNFGPTLLRWLERKAPAVYRAVLDGDRASRERFAGHGSALAQAYNHMILPLANPKDQVTQIVWGIADFKHRFAHAPEGMWLPETAVDVATLETLAAHAIAFTILAPHQAARVRPLAGGAWQEVGDRVDTTMPYLVRLPSGRTLSVFFYDGRVSHAVAFEGLLADGAVFAERLLAIATAKNGRPRLAHIAADGETFGHHHRHGDMALAYALDHVEKKGARVTNYGAYLAAHPPEWEAQVAPKTSWSCAHGIERWRTDCGCKAGTDPTWHQAWRRPLRDALDWLRDELAQRFEKEAAALVRDPWRARDEYIAVVLDRSPEVLARFAATHAARSLNYDDQRQLLRLCEAQRYAMLMFTSCGWFFDELSRIEGTQLLRYAARALELAGGIGTAVEVGFMERLAWAQSNLREVGNGRRLYEQRIAPLTQAR